MYLSPQELSSPTLSEAQPSVSNTKKMTQQIRKANAIHANISYKNVQIYQVFLVYFLIKLTFQTHKANVRNNDLDNVFLSQTWFSSLKKEHFLHQRNQIIVL